MDRVAEAAAAVRAARRRLVAGAAADGATRGALLGTVAGAAAWLAARWAPADAGLWPIAAPVAGAIVGAALALRRGVATDVAALTLDAAARTEEAFVSALSVRDAAPQIRESVAGYAVERCPPSSVGRFLPLRAPRTAAASAVAAALLAALVLVPRAAATETPVARAPDDVLAGAAAAGSGAAPPASPRDRVDRLREVLGKDDAAPPPALLVAVRKDLAAVTDDDLRRLAEALVKIPATADAAGRALAALDRGDRAAASGALREALGGVPTVVTPDGTGAATASSAPPRAARTPWAAATWPLRYDRVVRRWLDETAATEAPPK